MTFTISDLTDISHSHKSASGAVSYAIAFLKSALPRFPIRKASRRYFEMQRDLPFFIQETAIPETHILVNRRYKPLGSNLPVGGDSTSGDGVKYEEFKTLHVRLTPCQITSIVSPGCSHALYKSINAPWTGKKAAQDYLLRLEKLHRLLIGVPIMVSVRRGLGTAVGISILQDHNRDKAPNAELG